MISVSVDGSELSALAKEATLAERGTAIYARQVVKSVSFAVERRIKQEMPVDTGRARASWGHGDDSIWIEEDGGLSITQGSNVEYIIYLNNGHSKQAPAGFIDRAELAGGIAIQEALGLLDPLEAEAQLAQIEIVAGSIIGRY